MSNKSIHGAKTTLWLRRATLGIALLAIILSILFLARVNRKTPELMLTKGYADATDSALFQAIHMVGGELAWYEGTHTPDQLEGLSPGLTKDIRYMRNMSGYTYVFTLRAMENLNFSMARPAESRVWVNGIEVSGAGTGNISPTLCYRLGDFGSGELFTFIIATPLLKDNARGYRGILLGSEADIKALQNAVGIADIISIGLYIMMIVLCLALYVQKRSEKNLILLTVIALLTMLRWLPIVRFAGFAQLSLPGIRPLAIFTRFLRYFVFYPFIPGKLRKKLLPAVCILAVAWLIGWALNAINLQELFYNCYILLEEFALAAGVLEGLSGCTALLCGCSVTISFEFFYMLLNTGVLPQGAIDVYIQPMPFSGLFYLVCCAVAVFGVFAGKYQEADDLSANLEFKVEKQTAELRKTNDLLVQSQVDKQRFLATVAHNIRTPLFALGGYLDLLIKASPDATKSQEKNLYKASAKLENINKMVDSILFMSRLEDGKIEFHFMNFSLREMLESVVSDAALKAGTKEIKIQLKDRDIPKSLVGDRFWIQQALDNLLDNAVRYSKNGSGITINAKTVLPDKISISIADQGIGIDPDLLPKLFERYNSDGKEGSLGLGLPISREIIRRHNGVLNIDSQVGHGTTVVIELPIKQ